MSVCHCAATCRWRGRHWWSVTLTRTAARRPPPPTARLWQHPRKSTPIPSACSPRPETSALTTDRRSNSGCRGRDIAAGWRDRETPCASLPTRSPSQPRTAARKAGVLDTRKQLRERDRLSAGGLEGRRSEPSVPRQGAVGSRIRTSLTLGRVIRSNPGHCAPK